MIHSIRMTTRYLRKHAMGNMYSAMAHCRQQPFDPKPSCAMLMVRIIKSVRHGWHYMNDIIITGAQLVSHDRALQFNVIHFLELSLQHLLDSILANPWFQPSNHSLLFRHWRICVPPEQLWIHAIICFGHLLLVWTYCNLNYHVILSWYRNNYGWYFRFIYGIFQNIMVYWWHAHEWWNTNVSIS